MSPGEFAEAVKFPAPKSTSAIIPLSGLKVMPTAVGTDRVNLDDVPETTSRGSALRGNHLQRSVLDAPTRLGRSPIPHGGGCHPDRFGRDDWFSGHHPGASPGIGIPWRARFAQGRNARSRPEHLSNSLPLRTATRQPKSSA